VSLVDVGNGTNPVVVSRIPDLKGRGPIGTAKRPDKSLVEMANTRAREERGVSKKKGGGTGMKTLPGGPSCESCLTCVRP